ncbi:MAG TPA: hypothetical protein VN840_07620 [Streptosporangiaceae bacterium]|nr:hypothetical protein [Streptosporangiaceae bacterium]
MTPDSAALDHARKVADAVLYEGYLLYPYHRAAQKNQVRFQFGVLMPPAYGDLDPSEPSASQTECLLECGDQARVLVRVRFLELQRRTVQEVMPGTGELRDVETLLIDGTEFSRWDEATEREQQVVATVADLLGTDTDLPVSVGAGQTCEDLTSSAGAPAGRLIRRWAALHGVVRLHAERVAGPYGALRLRVRIENHTVPDPPPCDRDDALRHALIAAHTLISVPGGSFISMTDPPQWAAAEVAACVNIGTWPVLAGPQDCHDLMLSSPVILYDHPEIAKESAGDLFDATEIDEILTLRTLALTDAEKQAARATDARAAELIDRVDGLPPEMLERMHGAIRYLRAAPAALPPVTATGPGDDLFAERPSVPWWDPGSDASVSPDSDHVIIDGVPIARGSLVRMRPGARRADAQDLFLVGREARVEAVLHDVDGNVHLAVTPEHDPAADLHRSHGRFLYFATDEIEPIEPARHGRARPEEETA